MFGQGLPKLLEAGCAEGGVVVDVDPGRLQPRRTQILLFAAAKVRVQLDGKLHSSWDDSDLIEIVLKFSLEKIDNLGISTVNW